MSRGTGTRAAVATDRIDDGRNARLPDLVVFGAHAQKPRTSVARVRSFGSCFRKMSVNNDLNVKWKTKQKRPHVDPGEFREIMVRRIEEKNRLKTRAPPPPRCYYTRWKGFGTPVRELRVFFVQTAWPPRVKNEPGGIARFTGLCSPCCLRLSRKPFGTCFAHNEYEIVKHRCLVYVFSPMRSHHSHQRAPGITSNRRQVRLMLITEYRIWTHLCK